MEKIIQYCQSLSEPTRRDLNELARRVKERIDLLQFEWVEGCPLRYDIVDYEGDITITGELWLEEQGDWRYYGDELFFLKHDEPTISSLSLEVEFFDNSEPIGVKFLIDEKELLDVIDTTS